jgi:large subunit ribosomal protein L1
MLKKSTKKKPTENMKKKDTSLYSIVEAIKKVKESAKERFDATVELHINLNLDSKKVDQPVRFSVALPNGTGKTKRVAVLASTKTEGADLELLESDIENIEKGKIRPKVDFDVLVAEPKFMAKLAKVAKILGPAGVMPNPKTGTVSENPSKAVELIKKGKVDIKTEKDIPVIHTIIGKISFSDEALVQNFTEIVTAFKQNKPAKAGQDWIRGMYICSSMGPACRIDSNPIFA